MYVFAQQTAPVAALQRTCFLLAGSDSPSEGVGQRWTSRSRAKAALTPALRDRAALAQRAEARLLTLRLDSVVVALAGNRGVLGRFCITSVTEGGTFTAAS